MPIKKTCIVCGKDFYVKPYRAEISKHCSKPCAYISLNRQIEKKCASCGKSFMVPNNIHRKGAKYCSLDCYYKSNTGERHWNYKHGYGKQGEPKRRRELSKKHYDANQKKIYNETRHRRLRKKGVKGYHSHRQWEELLSASGFKCFYCGTSIEEGVGKNLATRDHVIPIMRGGHDDIDNIVPACKSCNSSKGNMTAEEYINYRERVTK